MTDKNTHRPAARVMRAIASEPWAITAEGLDLVLSIAARENDISPEALEAYRARHVPSAERMTARGNIAVIDVRGPMFRYANIFTELSGATSYDAVRRDLQAALDDNRFKALVINIDSPGGEVTGVAELADAIRAGRDRKRIVAYVGGTGASAAYWLASAASEIVAAETAILGSIGVRAIVQDTSEADRKTGRLEFVSSQSPGKRAAPDTDEGRARVQRMVDALAEVFVAAVAKGRGVSTRTVLDRFGAGDVLVGAAAVKAGMADRIGSFEAVIAQLAGKMPAPSASAATETGATERIRAIIEHPEALERQQAARHIAFSTTLSPADAVVMLRTMARTSAAPAAPRTETHRIVESSLPPTVSIIPVRPDQARLPEEEPAVASWAKALERVNRA